jgi:hypothetical protein
MNVITFCFIPINIISVVFCIKERAPSSRRIASLLAHVLVDVEGHSFDESLQRWNRWAFALLPAEDA